LQEFQAEKPQIDDQVEGFYGDFVSDVIELSKPVLESTFKSNAEDAEALGTDEKIALFLELAAKTKQTLSKLENKTVVSSENIESLFQEWGTHVIEMRLRQEYETIKGLLTTTELAKIYGMQRLQQAMERVQKKFGEETVNIALDVTLKVGMPREKLQTVMLSDHFIDYRMNIAKLDGNMQFFNCPVAGSHSYIAHKIGISDSVAALFCKHICYAHAKAMLETVLPFTFVVSAATNRHPRKMRSSMKLASPSAKVKAEFIPLVVSECHSESATWHVPLLHKRHQG
jgi:hypothetical protein